MGRWPPSFSFFLLQEDEEMANPPSLFKKAQADNSYEKKESERDVHLHSSLSDWRDDHIHSSHSASRDGDGMASSILSSFPKGDGEMATPLLPLLL